MAYHKRRSSLPAIMNETHSTLVRRNTIFVCEKFEQPTFRPKRRRNELSIVRVKLDTVFNHLPKKSPDLETLTKLPKLDLGRNLDVDETLKSFKDYHRINVMAKLFISILNTHENSLTSHDLDCLYNLLIQVENCYLENAYHNSCHAIDVLATTEVLLNILNSKVEISFEQRFALLFAAACHDIAHPGVTSNFIKSYFPSKSENYTNDSGLLEQMHAKISLQLLRDSGFSAEKMIDLEPMIFDAIMATDMTKHNEQIDMLKSIVPENLKNLLPIVLHAADIFNPIKQFEHAMFWGRKIFIEMETQEHLDRALKELEVTDMNPVKLQIGFIQFFAKPFFDVFSQVIGCPEIIERLDVNFSIFSNLNSM